VPQGCPVWRAKLGKACAGGVKLAEDSVIKTAEPIAATKSRRKGKSLPFIPPSCPEPERHVHVRRRVTRRLDQAIGVTLISIKQAEAPSVAALLGGESLAIYGSMPTSSPRRSTSVCICWAYQYRRRRLFCLPFKASSSPQPGNRFASLLILLFNGKR
jgi:hypothetical protein